MGFGGSVSGMLTSLKNNKRPRKSALKKYKQHKFEEKGNLHFNKKASQKQLLEIRQKIQNENRKRTRLYLLFFFAFIVSILVILYFLKF